MKTRVFEAGEKRICYIDKIEFEELVKEGKIKIENEYPNWRYKECSDCTYILMNKEDWILKLKEEKGKKYRYSITSNIGWFPDEPIAKYKKVSVGYKGMITRYNIEFDEDIGFDSSGSSSCIYTNNKDGLWKTKLEKSGFKVLFS